MTHDLPVAHTYLEQKNPKWYQQVTEVLNKMKDDLGTDDFEVLMQHIQAGNNPSFEIPQLKDEMDTSGFCDFMIDNNLFAKKRVTDES